MTPFVPHKATESKKKALLKHHKASEPRGDEAEFLSPQTWVGKAEQAQQREERRDAASPAGEGGVQREFRVVTRSELELRLILHFCVVH